MATATHRLRVLLTVFATTALLLQAVALLPGAEAGRALLSDDDDDSAGDEGKCDKGVEPPRFRQGEDKCKDGDVVEYFYHTSPRECETLCAERPWCTFFSSFIGDWYAEDCKLYAKCKDREEDSTEYESGRKRTWKPPSPSGDGYSYVVRKQLSCKDKTVETIRDTTEEECMEACNRDCECNFFTFNTCTGSCYTKRTCDKQEANGADISGIRDRSGMRDPYGIMVPSTRINYKTCGGSSKVISYDEWDNSYWTCEEKCMEDSDCVAFMIDAGDWGYNRAHCTTFSTCDSLEDEPSGADYVLGIMNRLGNGKAEAHYSSAPTKDKPSDIARGTNLA